MLESFCIEQGIQDFGAFLDACNAIPDLSQVMAFTPIDDSQVSLSLVDIRQHIGVVRMLESDGPIMVQCHLGIWFVGVPACELKKLLCDVQSPFSCKQCSHMSTKSTQSYIGGLTVGHQTSNVAQQSAHTGLPVHTECHHWTYAT